jgi:exosortase/archaeosortase family protein
VILAKPTFGAARPQLDWWAGRAALLAVVVIAGYWLSLATLWRDLAGQTPTAFIGLAPILAAGLLVAGLRRRTSLPLPGRIDLLLGLALIALAAIIVFIVPFAASVYFWAARLDILSLPLFVGGALVVLFGWRVLFVSRGALLLLLLTWPLPYLALIENSSEALTNVTAAVVGAVTSFAPIASPVKGSDATFLVAYAPDPFQVQIATACAGLNSTVAFLLVGGAFTLLLEGRILAKLLWLALGLTVVFAFNVVRVVLLITVGAAFGQAAAIDMFHPVAGLLALFLALVLMLGLVRRFGLRVPALRPRRIRSGPSRRRPPVPITRRRRTLAARGAVLVFVATLFATANATFAAYEADPNGQASVAQPLNPASTVADRLIRSSQEILAGKPYYGEDSRWMRYRLGAAPGTAPANRYALWLDDIRVTDRQRLVDFNVEKCYRFHGQSIDASQAVALGRGVIGRIVQTQFSERGPTWIVLWWEWPVQVGAAVEHERVALLAPATVTVTPPSGARTGGVPFDFGSAVADAYRPLAEDLAAYASDIVAAQTTATGTAAR